jgi:hypothetical protein
MITLSETYPRIIAVVDWECSTAFPTSFFAQYPLFIVDHPLRIRNVRDRSVFNKLIPEAERKIDLDSGQPLPRHSPTLLVHTCSNNGGRITLSTQSFILSSSSLFFWK